jgi:hypothetical protein
MTSPLARTPLNRRTILHHAAFHQASTTLNVWVSPTHSGVAVPVLAMSDRVENTAVWFSLHTQALPPEGPLHEVSYPGYTRVAVPRTGDWWRVTTPPPTTTMVQPVYFPRIPLQVKTPIPVHAWALWLGDAVVATAPMDVILCPGEYLSIHLTLTFP